MYRFEKLHVWQKAMDFSEEIYRLSNKFPKEELFGLTSQLRRATTSIPLNIAEGSGCQTKKEFVHFSSIALRSQYEVVTILKLSHRLKFIQEKELETFQEMVDEVGRLLQGLINSLKKH